MAIPKYATLLKALKMTLQSCIVHFLCIESICTLQDPFDHFLIHFNIWLFWTVNCIYKSLFFLVLEKPYRPLFPSYLVSVTMLQKYSEKAEKCLSR